MRGKERGKGERSRQAGLSFCYCSSTLACVFILINMRIHIAPNTPLAMYSFSPDPLLVASPPLSWPPPPFSASTHWILVALLVSLVVDWLVWPEHRTPSCCPSCRRAGFPVEGCGSRSKSHQSAPAHRPRALLPSNTAHNASQAAYTNHFLLAGSPARASQGN